MRVIDAFARCPQASILLAALLVFAGCRAGSESSSSGEESTEAGRTSEEISETTTEETTPETTGGRIDETSGETADSTRPYTAIAASAESGSGPSDEVLVDGAEDFSDRPLKETGS